MSDRTFWLCIANTVWMSAVLWTLIILAVRAVL